MLFKLLILLPSLMLAPKALFIEVAASHKVDAAVLEGICRYESDRGRVKKHHNKNGTWDVGYCQNHRYYRGEGVPSIPTDQQSIKEAAEELKYWSKQHDKFCVKMLSETGKCGYLGKRKWIGVKDCKRPHPWWSHYNHGFRVLTNNYTKQVQCFIDNNFKKCKKNQWNKINF